MLRVALLAGCLAPSSAFLSPISLVTARLPARATLPASRAGLRTARAAPMMMTVTPQEAGRYKDWLTKEQKAALEETAQKIATFGKGITACDEGPGTIGDRFEKVGIVNTEENRRLYRQMLFTCPGADKYLSAAILDPETIYQKSDDGTPFPELLTKRGIVPGVKPHLKVFQLPGCMPGETVMQGLDSLAMRAKEYYNAGARFAKWRSPLVIGPDGQMSDLAIRTNMEDLARYALICQSEGLMPIVEPDIQLIGDYDLETAIRINVQVQAHLYKAMIDHGVYMEGATLKPNMVNPGKGCKTKYTADEIGLATVTVLRRVMPAAMKGVNFLSGGQSLENASARLNAINKHKGNSPWNLSFSWSQALQLPLLDICKKNPPGSALPIEEMTALLQTELVIAGAAARGEFTPAPGQGDHLAA
mmetsp:Transcript_30748/g.73048  ORF Transcript_30748/g.73048 Transcript_30748/m.73048 type:complete len:418 (-) Transcript_30748:198-1451(-)